MKQVAAQALPARWARVGVLFHVSPHPHTPDLERLLLETTGQLQENPRLLVMTATWLSRYHRLIARHRFARMVGEYQDPNALAALGLLLDTVAARANLHELGPVKSLCRPAPTAMPLFNVDRATPAMAAFVHRRASRLSRKWKLWAEEMELKPEALRPLGWILEANPSVQMRAIFGGNLRASILACLEFDRPDGASEAELARLCGVTRKAVHEAVEHLEFCSFISRRRTRRNYQITLKHPSLRIAG